MNFKLKINSWLIELITDVPRDVSLQVQQPIDNSTISQGIRLAMTCTARGNPIPSKYQWYQNVSYHYFYLLYHFTDYICTSSL